MPGCWPSCNSWESIRSDMLIAAAGRIGQEKIYVPKTQKGRYQTVQRWKQPSSEDYVCMYVTWLYVWVHVDIFLSLPTLSIEVAWTQRVPIPASLAGQLVLETFVCVPSVQLEATPASFCAWSGDLNSSSKLPRLDFTCDPSALSQDGIIALCSTSSFFFFFF